jgi:GTPase Era involved in 16S rRNA processing
VVLALVNACKSTLMNAITRRETSIVDTAASTTAGLQHGIACADGAVEQLVVNLALS